VLLNHVLVDQSLVEHPRLSDRVNLKVGFADEQEDLDKVVLKAHDLRECYLLVNSLVLALEHAVEFLFSRLGVRKGQQTHAVAGQLDDVQVTTLT